MSGNCGIWPRRTDCGARHRVTQLSIMLELFVQRKVRLSQNGFTARFGVRLPYFVPSVGTRFSFPDLAPLVSFPCSAYLACRSCVLLNRAQESPVTCGSVILLSVLGRLG
ncbi:hypothetical protein U1Q18_031369 [Sarracenia purpurea var. burkii]